MNSAHFIEWIEKAASHLRLLHGSTPRIAIIIDNATWHNELAEESKPPKRSWRKDQLQQWLDQHGITYDAKFKKAELLEIAFANVPSKRYKTNAAANIFNVELLRLPIKHCILNPIELAWAQLKAYVRSNNTNFRLTDIRALSEEYIAALDDETSRRFINHVRKAQEQFRTADDFVEEDIEPNLLSEDEHSEADVDMDTDEEEDTSF
jgi:transposase